jgi:hypothetical protein
MRTLLPLLLLVIGCALIAQSPLASPDAAAACAPAGSTYMRTTLYFGLARRSGAVTESQWHLFLRDEVTPRFPDGLTVWEANGQWRRADGKITREKAKVLLLVHEDTQAVHATVSDIVATYKKRFQQESVLWESARGCAAF